MISKNPKYTFKLTNRQKNPSLFLKNFKNKGFEKLFFFYFSRVGLRKNKIKTLLILV